MICPDCKTKNFSFAEYCSKCQRQLTRKSHEQIENDRRRSRGLFTTAVEK